MANLSGLSTNFFPTAVEGYVDNLSGSISAGAATVPVNDASDYSTGQVAVLVVDPGTNNEAVFIGQKDTGNQFINCVWTEGNTAAGHTSGAVVADYVASTTFDAMSKGIQQFLNQSGKMKNTAVTEDNRVIAYFSPSGIVAPFAGSAAPSGWLMCDGSAVSRSTYAALFTAIGTAFGAGNGSTTFNVPDLRSRLPIGVGAGTYTTTFAAADVNTGTDVITVPTNDSLHTGMAVVLTAGTTAPTGLTSGSTYYVIRVSSTTIKLATSQANAIAGTAIDITGAGSGTNTLTFTFTNHSLADKGGQERHSTTIAEMPSHTHIQDSHNHTIPNFNAAGGGSAVASVGGGNVTATSNTTATNQNTGGSSDHNVLNPYLALNYIIKT